MPTINITGLNSKAQGISVDSAEPIPFGLPGDQYDTDAQTVLPQSEHRQTPPCTYFETCGGCVLQHATDAFVESWKTHMTIRALATHGLEPPFRDTITSPLHSRRRAVFSARRTKKTTQVGFHARRSDQIVPITRCHVIEPEILAALPFCHGLTKLGATRTSVLKISVTSCLNGLDVAVDQGKDLSPDQIADLAQVAVGHRVQRLSWNGDVLMRQPAMQIFGNALVEPPSGAFLQATKSGEGALLAGVLAGVSDAANVVDLFSGSGTFTLPVAKIADVLAVESSAEMLSALDRGWREAEGLKHVRCEVRDLFRRPLLAQELNRFDAAIIDPPRAGAQAQVAQIASAQIGRIAFVSCNPVSFARDAKTLCDAGYALDWVQVVDQFRWSHHVELVAQFTK